MKIFPISILLSLSILLSAFSLPASAKEAAQPLTDTLTVTYQYYQKSTGSDSTWNIEFPVVSGFQNKELEKTINQKIRSFFLAGPQSETGSYSLNGNANAVLAGSVGIFFANALYSSGDTVYYWYDSIAIDLTNSTVYTLNDLFVPGYQSRLNDMLAELDDNFTGFTGYRFTPFGVQFYTEHTTDRFLYLSYTGLASIINTKGSCYKALTSEKFSTPVSRSSLPFTDVPQSYWAFPYIYDAYQNGTLSGTNNTFRPDASITGAEFCNAIARKLKLTGVSSPAYPSIQQNKWYSDMINTIYQTGLLSGAEKTFAPEQPITRENAMIILANVLDYQKKSHYLSDSEADRLLSQFSDVSGLPQNARHAAAICVSENLINGSNGKLLPKGYITRAQTAKILCLL